MEMTDYVIRERLPELWRQIEMTHLSYLQTEESPDKLDERKKLEGYIAEYLCLVPHENKFILRETGELLSRSALLPDFSACRLARGWAALARYASNLLAQNWRKEYRTIRLYSGYYKHEVEGAGLEDARDMLRAMGYRQEGTPQCLTLDGPVCPDEVTAVSRDSLIAYVECQIMDQIWEEVSLRGGSCSWLEVLQCREEYSGDVDQAATIILYSQRNSKDIYSNVKFPGSHLPKAVIKNNISYQSPQINDYGMQQNYNMRQQQQQQHINPHCHQPISNGYIQNGQTMAAANGMPVKAQMHDNNMGMVNNHPDPHTMYCSNPMAQAPQMNHTNGVQRGPLEVNPMYRFNNMNLMNQCTPIPGYYYNPIPPQQYVMQAPLAAYGPVRQATTLPLANGYHCPQLPVPQPTYYPTVPTGQLIELDIPLTNYPPNNHSHHACPNMSSPKQTIKPDRKRLDNGRDPHFKIHHSGSMDSKNNVNQLTAAHNSKNHDSSFENQENARRNSAPRSSASYTSDHNFSIPRSDTQPSLSKAREDGMGTFESWDYVFRNLESQGYNKDLGERGNILSPPLERDSKTLGRVGSRDPKRYMQTTMDLEDGLHAIRLEKDTDEEMYRTAKTNETLLKIKQENEAKAAKAHTRRHILADEKDKRKSNSYDMSVSPSKDPNDHFKVVNDKVRLISKEDAKEKKEIDKNTYSNGTNTTRISDTRKAKKSIVKCLSSEMDNVNTTTIRKEKKPTVEHSAQAVTVVKKTPPHVQASTSSSNHHARQPSQGADSTDGSLKTRLVVTLSMHEPDRSPPSKTTQQNGAREHKRTRDSADHHNPTIGDYLTTKKSQQAKGKSSKEVGAGLWECGTCTYANGNSRNSCEMCGKSRQVGVEAVPLMSGGKECPSCTLVNNRDATVCTVCDTNLKHSPTYI